MGKEHLLEMGAFFENLTFGGHSIEGRLLDQLR